MQVVAQKKYTDSGKEWKSLMNAESEYSFLRLKYVLVVCGGSIMPFLSKG